MRTHRSAAHHVGPQDVVLAQVHRDHLMSLLGSVRRYASSDEDAEDAVQDAFAKAWAAEISFSDADHCLRWLVVTARNRLIDGHRSAANRLRAPAGREVVNVPTDLAESPTEVIERRELASQVHGVLKRIPASHGGLLWHRHAEGEAVSDAAARVGVTAGSASVLLTRAKRGFRVAWESSVNAIAFPFLWLAGRLAGRRSDNVGYAVATTHALASLAPALVALLVVGGSSSGDSPTLSSITPTGLAAMHAASPDSADGPVVHDARTTEDVANLPPRRTIAEVPTAAATVSVTQGAPPAGSPTAGLLVTVEAAGESETVGFRYYEDVEGGSCVHARVTVGEVAMAECD